MTTGRRSRDMSLLVLSVLFYWISLYLYVPTLPSYVRIRTGSLAEVGVVLSMYGLLMGLLRLPVGVLSDLLGRRKPFALVGLALGGLGAWTMGSSGGASGVLLGRALTGIAATAWVPLVVLFSGMFPPAEAVRVTALLTLVLNIGRILATSLTGWLNGIGGYSLAFYSASGAAVVSMLLILPVREAKRGAGRPSLAAAVALVRRPDVLLPALLSAINLYADYTVTFGFMPILAAEMGASDGMKSALVTLNLVAVAGGSLVVAALARRVGTRSLVWASVTLLSIGVALAAASGSLGWLAASQIVFGFAAGSGYSVFMGLSIRYVSPSDRATAIGLHQAVYASGMFAGPWMSGLLGDTIGIRGTFVVTALACFALSAAVIAGIGRRSAHRESWKRRDDGNENARVERRTEASR